MLVAGFQTHRCDISEHLSLKRLLDVSTVPLLLLHYVFPLRVWHNEASLQHWQLGWRCLNTEDQRQRNSPLHWQMLIIIIIIMTGNMTGEEDTGLWVQCHTWQTGQDLLDLAAHTHTTHSTHTAQGKALNLLTSASALCDFFASVLESVALTSQQHEMACSRNNVVLISKRKKKKKKRKKNAVRRSS